MEIGNIKRVAIYLRKSRGDKEQDVLGKHRKRLMDYAKTKGWQYDIFEEVVSGASISSRPQMQQLIDLVEEGLYDGILVVHYDRLSRGGSRDFGEIIEVCQITNTLIITPDKIYDTNDNTDLMMLGMQNVFSNNELRTIIQRFVNGKKDGVREGKWTNGKPPFPYEYQKEIVIDEKGRKKVNGTVVVNKEQAEIYKIMKDMYLSGDKGFEAIAFELNRNDIPSPSGKDWTSITVQRILLHEFHTGVVMYGKNKWGKKRNGQRKIVQKREVSEITQGIGEHEVLKTQEEHNRMLEILNRNNKIPKKSRAGTFATSGILYCKKCGSRMGYSIGRVEAKTGKQYHFTKCTHKSPTGEKCGQKGVKMTEEFYEAIFNTIIKNYLNKEHINKIEKETADLSIEHMVLEQKKRELKDAKEKLNRIFEAYEGQIYTLEQFTQRKVIQEETIDRLTKDINKLDQEFKHTVSITPEELAERIEYFRNNWFSATTPTEKNTLLKSIVNKIYYDRQGDIITFEIEYL